MAQKCLWSEDPEAVEHLKYLREKRKLDDEVIRNFGFGYVPSQVALDCNGVTISRRIIMPLRDSYGELVAITTRDATPDAFMAHFHESFDKGEHLYGLHQAKTNIIRKKKAIVVEGQFDAAYLHSIGFNMSVAILGSAMSLTQAALLSRYCDEVYLLFDGDTGGYECTKRTMKIYREKYLDRDGMLFVPCALDEDKDPDDLNKTELLTLFKESKKRALANRR